MFEDHIVDAIGPYSDFEQRIGVGGENGVSISGLVYQRYA